MRRSGNKSAAICFVARMELPSDNGICGNASSRNPVRMSWVVGRLSSGRWNPMLWMSAVPLTRKASA
jgi:hypothetical protein